MEAFDSYRERFETLSTTNISDALDALGLKGATYGIRPMWHMLGRVLGPAVTVRMVTAGKVSSKNHLGVTAITKAEAGDVIVIANSGRLDTSCWGGILANAAKMKGISGTIVDGAIRDVDDCIDCGYTVFARSSVVATARGRITEAETNGTIEIAGVQVNPGDIVFGDRSGVVFIPREHLEAVLDKAEELQLKEEAMISAIRNGEPLSDVDSRFGYEQMLKGKK